MRVTRRIIDFGIQPGDVDGYAPCRVCTRTILAARQPKYLSPDNVPLFNHHQRRANLRILDFEPIKTTQGDRCNGRAFL